MNYPKRLIEVDLPIRRISAHARREKSIRHGHISTLHIWWARRPLAACRAVICAALWPDPADEACPQAFRKAAAQALCNFAEKVRTDETLAGLCKDSWSRWLRTTPAVMRGDNPAAWGDMRYALLDFIADFANWDASTVPAFLETARALTQAAHEALGGAPGTRPLVVDPFAGGGSIPLEALRVGADTFASDLNPVAAMLNRVALEYAPRYGQQLVGEVRRWGEWVNSQAQERLEAFYPREQDGSVVVGYWWARTIICEGPGCGVEVPIIKNQVIRPGRDSAVAVQVVYDSGRLITRLLKGADAAAILGGTSRRSSVTCPACGFTTSRSRVEAQANERGFGFHLLAVCTRSIEGRRHYRQPTAGDLVLLDRADESVAEWQGNEFGGIPAIPSEELPYLRSIFNVRVYGIDRWYKLYHRRQLLSALVFTSITRQAAEHIRAQTRDRRFADAVIECVALSVSNAFQYQCNIATYLTEGVKSAFIQGQSLPMKMDFIEANPLMDELAGGYPYSLAQHVSGLEYLASFEYPPGHAANDSATNQLLPDDSVDLTSTDPPYYDVVPYADCSDFFYVWLRRMLHGFTDSCSGSELTPKDEEIVQLAERNERYRSRTKRWFEQKMREALSNCRQSTKPSGLAVIVFAHKETAAWEALIQSVLDAGWIITGSWPIDTEKRSRLRANNSAVLSSSIHLVGRPREMEGGSVDDKSVGDWRDVLAELPRRIHDWMPRLAAEGVVGADAIFACLGPALEIFSRYSRVEKASGDPVTLREYLEHVWAAVSREALAMIFEGADATGFEEDARLTAMWLWTLSAGDGYRGSGPQGDANPCNEVDDKEGAGRAVATSLYALEYDAARKIAQGLGVHLERLPSVAEVKGDTARLLTAAERTRHLFGKEEAQTPASRRARPQQLGLFAALDEAQAGEGGWGEKSVPHLGATVLDRVHQAMILFAAGRSEALKRFLVADGAGKDARFWRLAQPLSALYPAGSEEKRWVDGVLARKKGLGF